MKLLILLSICCTPVLAQDTICLTSEQVRNVYVGLRLSEEYKSRYEQSLQASYRLDSIIQAQNDSIQASVLRLKSVNAKLIEKQEERLNLPPVWYKHPITWAIIGFISGILIAK